MGAEDFNRPADWPEGADSPEGHQWKLFRDLRGRNERRSNVARMLETQRRARIERVIQAARQRRFRKTG